MNKNNMVIISIIVSIIFVGLFISARKKKEKEDTRETSENKSDEYELIYKDFDGKIKEDTVKIKNNIHDRHEQADVLTTEILKSISDPINSENSKRQFDDSKISKEFENLLD